MFEDRKLAVAALAWLFCCDRPPPAPNLDMPPPPPSASTLDPTFIDATFSQIYQVLLLNGLAPFEKAERWSHDYRQRWVRWTGQLMHIKPDSMWFRQIEGTMTYDVMVRTARSPGQPPPQVQAGRFYNYVGRLDRYDDGFGTIYLDQGVVFDAGPDGVPGTLSLLPQMSRRVPPPQLMPQPLPK